MKQREVMNVIKLMCNELAIPIVGVGTSEAVRVLHHDAQHSSRFDIAKLPRWELNQDFQRFLAGLELILPLRKPSKIHRAEIAQAIHLATAGILGDVHRLLVECSIQAIRSSTETITKDIIESKTWSRSAAGVREISL